MTTITDDLKQKDDAAAGQDKLAQAQEAKAGEAHEAAAAEHQNQADEQISKSKS